MYVSTRSINGVLKRILFAPINNGGEEKEEKKSPSTCERKRGPSTIVVLAHIQ